MLTYVGHHELLDVGIATLVAMARKKFPDKTRPEQISEVELQALADELYAIYSRSTVINSLYVIFPNSGFTQPKFSAEKKAMYADLVIKQNPPQLPGTHCIFTGEPAVNLVLKIKGKVDILPGRAFRQHVPLVMAEKMLNFHHSRVGAGDGFPISRQALLAFHALPLGCAWIRGGLLAVHSHDPETILNFAEIFYNENLGNILKSPQKMLPTAEYGGASETLVETLEKIQHRNVVYAEDDDRPVAPIRAYHFSNSGQSAWANIYDLPLSTTAFLKDMSAEECWREWGLVLMRPIPQDQKEVYKQKRRIYDSVCELGQNPLAAVRLSRRILRCACQVKDMEFSPLIDSLLRRVLNMPTSRIEQIKGLAESLARYAEVFKDKRLIFDLWRVENYYRLNDLISRANQKWITKVENGQPPREPFLNIDLMPLLFEDEVGKPNLHWRSTLNALNTHILSTLYKNNAYSLLETAAFEEDEGDEIFIEEDTKGDDDL